MCLLACLPSDLLLLSHLAVTAVLTAVFCNCWRRQMCRYVQLICLSISPAGSAETDAAPCGVHNTQRQLNSLAQPGATCRQQLQVAVQCCSGPETSDTDVLEGAADVVPLTPFVLPMQ
jgi:hypothetical protein